MEGQWDDYTPDLPLPERGEEIGMDLVPSQMFVRGMMPSLAARGHFDHPQGGIDFDGISGTIKELRIRWEANYAEDRAGTPTAAPARRGTPGGPERGRGGVPKGPEVPSSDIPPADLTYLHVWGQDPIGIGAADNFCNATGKPWKLTTWQDVVDMVDIANTSRGSDGGYVQWLASSLKNKDASTREVTARAKAIVAHLEDSPFG